MPESRIRMKELRRKIMLAEDTIKFFKDGTNVGASGFTPAGYPKVVPKALSNAAKKHNIKFNLMTGASVGDELDGELARCGMIAKRFPYQTNKDCRNHINNGLIEFNDMHLSNFPQWVKYGFLGDIDVALVEAVAITEDGYIVPSTSVGASNVFIQKAKKIIVEINNNQPLELEGFHDIYNPLSPPDRREIPIYSTSDRIGTNYIPCDPEKIIGIVMTDVKDSTNELAPVDDISKKMAENLMGFLNNEIKYNRVPKDLLPLQSGVGSVANAVLNGLADSKFNNINIYSEVLQDSVLDLIDCGKINMASATSLTLSDGKLKYFHEKINKYKDKIILRPQEISNNPEVIRRLGVIAINTAIEVDIYGNVNSSNIVGSRIMNGIGGSGDFARNAYISIFVTQSTANDGKVSSIVPMVSHVDHTEHDVQIIVTEHGVADLRGLSPKERAKTIIENCTSGEYKDMLKDYFSRSLSESKYKHTPHVIGEALSWHERLIKTGTMKT